MNTANVVGPGRLCGVPSPWVQTWAWAGALHKRRGGSGTWSVMAGRLRTSSLFEACELRCIFFLPHPPTSEKDTIHPCVDAVGWVCGALRWVRRLARCSQGHPWNRDSFKRAKLSGRVLPARCRTFKRTCASPEGFERVPTTRRPWGPLCGVRQLWPSGTGSQLKAKAEARATPTAGPLSRVLSPMDQSTSLRGSTGRSSEGRGC